MSLAVPGSASGQTRDAAGAEKLYEDGSKLLAKDDWTGACAKFQDSFALDPAPGTMLNLAACAEHDGKIALAWSRLKEAQSLNADTKSEKQRKQIASFIEQSLARVEPKLPYLTVELATPVEGATFRRDGQPLVPGAALPIDPGEHVIEVTAPGHVTAKRTVRLAEAQREVVKLTLERAAAPEPATTASPAPTAPPPVTPPPPPPAPAPSTGETRMSPLRLVGLVVGGVGLAGLGVSIGTGVAASGKESELEELGCLPTDRGTTACPPDVTEAARGVSEDGESLALVSTITTFAGGAALGVGVLLVVLGADEPIVATESATLRVAPMPVPSGGGLMLTGEL